MTGWPPPLRFDRPVLLLGGGPAAPEAVAALAPLCGAVVAADGGANRLRAAGAAPDAIIGDLDSLEDRAGWEAAPGTDVIHVADQDTTDLEKCLRLVEAPLILGAGFLGGRFDHSLAAMHALMRHPERRLVLVGEEDLAFLAPLRWRARVAAGARVSVFPMGRVTALGSRGLVWPLAGLEMEAGAVIGTSNRAADPEVAIDFDRRAAVIMLERRFLESAVAGLSEQV